MVSNAFIISLFAAFFFAVLPILTQATPFNFIKNLKGSQKGDQVKGVAHLKKYLQHFGYLNYPFGLESHAYDDDFDNFLEDAVRTYRTNFQLNTTGTLDDDTIRTMLRPRCGVPDMVNDANWMQLHNHKREDHMLHPNYNFFPESPKWPQSKTRLTYGFSYSVPISFREPIAHAFGKWAAVSHSLFAEASYLLADLKIAFARGDHGDGVPFDGRGGHVAHASRPTDGRLHFDADDLWTIGAKPGYHDVGSVALHEIGHLLGLQHSDILDAIMFPIIRSNTVKGYLAEDDIYGIKALYNNSCIV